MDYPVSSMLFFGILWYQGQVVLRGFHLCGMNGSQRLFHFDTKTTLSYSGLTHAVRTSRHRSSDYFSEILLERSCTFSQS
jgi:hypothetical protein